MTAARGGYPANLSVDYPERPLNRLTSVFRIITVIPIAIILALMIGPVVRTGEHFGWVFTVSAGGVPFLAVVLMLVFRRKYPRWWFDWNVALAKFSARVVSYLALLRDEYPSTDEDQSVHLEMPYPDAGRELNRWLPLVKWLLAIPHCVILFFLWIGAILAVIAAWFAILFTGRYPKGLFDYVVGVMRWSLRVTAYAGLLTTDRYPPFTLG